MPLPPPMRDGVYPVRSKVRPVVQKTAVEVRCDDLQLIGNVL